MPFHGVECVTSTTLRGDADGKQQCHEGYKREGVLHFGEW